MTDQAEPAKKVAIGGDFLIAAKRLYKEFESEYLPDKIIRVQSMTERERIEVAVKCSQGKLLGHLDAMTVLMCLVDDRGRRVFEDDQLDEVLNINTGLIQQISNEVDELSGVRPKTDAKKTEDTKKNSKPTTADDSPSN